MSDQLPAPQQTKSSVPYQPKRKANGTWAPGSSGHPGSEAGRARKLLNLATIQELQRAFNRGGRKAIDKVMKQQPALFLKMLVLLVPREMEVTHSNAIKQMSDEQIEAAIEAIQAMLDAKAAGAGAKVIEARAEPAALPARAPRRRRKAVKKQAGLGADGDTDVGRNEIVPVSPTISKAGGG